MEVKAAAGKIQLAACGKLFLLGLFLTFNYISWITLQNTQITTHASQSQIETLEDTPVSQTQIKSPTGTPASQTVDSSPRPTQDGPLPPTSPYDETKVAFLVETRPLPHLPTLFNHMANVMPPEWTFRFMGSDTAIIFMRSAVPIRRLEECGKLKMLSIPSNYSVSNRESISQMFTDKHLYRDILAPAEHLLVFQPDSVFCTKAPTTIDDFLKWDWIGAPWYKHSTYGGNGGLNLRKVSKVLEVLEKESRRVGDRELEDVWLSRRIMLLKGSTIPHANVSKTFSVESIWDERPLGYHIGWLGVHHGQIWDDQRQVDHIMEYCPEVKMILGMKLANDKPSGVTR